MSATVRLMLAAMVEVIHEHGGHNRGFEALVNFSAGVRKSLCCWHNDRYH